MRRSVCLFAGLLCVAAALHCGSVAAQEPDVAQYSIQKWLDTNTELYLRHVATYDLPQGNPTWLQPLKVFVLDIIAVEEGAYDDIMLDTNVGMSLVRGRVASCEADKQRYFEILCYPSLKDDCSPDKLIIYSASAAPRTLEPKPGRGDITHKLYRNADTYQAIGTPHGKLVPAPLSTIPVEKQIRVAYGGEYRRHSGYADLDFTFPPGQFQKYDYVQITSAEWENSDVKDLEMPYRGSQYSSESRLPPHIRPLSVWHPEDDSLLTPEGQDPARPESLRDTKENIIFIREAYAWKQDKKGKWGKKVNILPYLVEDTFRMLPIHGPNGLLPLGTHYNTYRGPE